MKYTKVAINLFLLFNLYNAKLSKCLYRNLRFSYPHDIGKAAFIAIYFEICNAMLLKLCARSTSSDFAGETQAK